MRRALFTLFGLSFVFQVGCGPTQSSSADGAPVESGDAAVIDAAPADANVGEPDAEAGPLPRAQGPTHHRLVLGIPTQDGDTDRCRRIPAAGQPMDPALGGPEVGMERRQRRANARS